MLNAILAEQKSFWIFYQNNKKLTFYSPPKDFKLWIPKELFKGNPQDIKVTKTKELIDIRIN